MFSLGCACGRVESQTDVPQRQGDCFSHVVSIDGVHVCYPENVMEYESIEDDECFSNPENLIGYESTGKDETQSTPQSLIEDENAEAAASEREYPRPLLQRRGVSPSRVRLALSTSIGSTLVNPSDHQPSGRSVADLPQPDSGNYDRIKLIGIDGEGVIHLMKNRSTRQFVVRKTVGYARTVFAKPIEAAILQDIFQERHNNIIRLDAFESYRLEGACYYLEYCSGGDLHQLVDQYRRHEEFLPEPFIWQVYQNLASALEFLHRGFDRRSDPDRRGICHRDVKPSNIFLRHNPASEYPDVVLADFGHATLDFATYDPAGTTIWQPPELPRHSPRGDVYSLGAVIHFLIHFEAPIAESPSGAPSTSSARDTWAAAPDARQPIMEFVDRYSDELICMMLVTLESEENKRKKSDQLLKSVSECIEMKYPPGLESLQEAAEAWPLTSWAFDHMLSARGSYEEGEGHEEEETGADQYFEMMDRFGWGMSRESSRSSSSAPSSARGSSTGSTLSSASSLGEAY